MEKEVHRGGIHVRHIAPKHWWNRAKWELLESYTSANGEVVVPAGFITDGASIAWFLRWRFSPTGRYFGPSIVHDYVLVEEKDWVKANDQFDKEMKACKVGTFDRFVMVNAVKFYAWLKYDLLGIMPRDRV